MNNKTINNIKNIFSLLLCILIISSIPVSTAYAQTGSADFEQPQHGIVIEGVFVRLTSSPEKKLSYTIKNGKSKRLNKGKKLTVIGRSNEKKQYFHIKVKLNSAWYYGYVDDKYIAIDNSFNYEEKWSEVSVSPYDKKEYQYPYYEYMDMPIHQFYQLRPGSINGLKINSSCGPHSLATVLSALTKQVITPEEIMYHMSRSCITSNRKGTYVSKVADSVKPYIENKYGYRYDYELIKPKQAFDYVKKGYFVIIGLENVDRQNLFTVYSHYITLIGYDDTGNIMTVNTNKKTALFEAFSESRIRKLIKTTPFYNSNTIAIKYKCDCTYNPLETAVQAEIVQDTVAYEHIDRGFCNKLEKNKNINVIGISGKNFYVEYNTNDGIANGFLPISATNLYANVSISQNSYTYNSKPHAPTITITDCTGSPLSEGDDYTIEYSDINSTDVGNYEIRINYTSGLYGEEVLKYSIELPKTKITSAAGMKKRFKIKFERINDVSGYQVEYSRYKDFSNSLKKNISSNTKGAVIKTKHRNAKYYIRIRAYKNTDSGRIYSEWSKAKAVRVV